MLQIAVDSDSYPDSDSTQNIHDKPSEVIVPKESQELLDLMDKKNLKGLKSYVDQGHPTR